MESNTTDINTTASYSAYLQHSAGPRGPFRTEEVDVKVTETPRNPSLSGYGARIPTRYMIRRREKGAQWQRVYCHIYSNVGSLYVGGRNGSDRITVDIHTAGW